MGDQWTAAFLTGMLATVNPCGFAMLPGFLAFYLGSDQPQTARRPLAAGLCAGVALGAGFGTVFVVSGLLLAVGMSVVIDSTPWLAVGIGAVLMVLGVLQLVGGTILTGRASGPLNRLGTVAAGIAQRRSGLQGMVGYGAAYAVAALSCSLALLLSVVAQATATGSIWALLSIFAAYATGSSVVLILLAVSAALSREALLRRVHRLMPLATRIGGAALALAGLYLVTYWVPVLTGSTPGGPVGDLVTAVSAEVSTAVSQHAALLTGLAAVVIALAAALAAATKARTTPPTPRSASPLQSPSDDCCAERPASAERPAPAPALTEDT